MNDDVAFCQDRIFDHASTDPSYCQEVVSSAMNGIGDGKIIRTLLIWSYRWLYHIMVLQDAEELTTILQQVLLVVAKL
jgi:hypothetical protein